jgi:hypothetical protein
MPSETALPFIPVRPRVHRVQIQGKSILTVDFSQATPGESMSMIEELSQAIAGQDPDSLLILTDVTGVTYDSSVSQKWKMAFVKFSPYVRASAIYGANGLVTVVINSYAEMMQWLGIPDGHKKARAFKDREKALAWLTKC